MATANPLEDILNSEVDESAIKSLVGSLESKLLSPTGKDTQGHTSTVPGNTNHVQTTQILSSVTAAHQLENNSASHHVGINTAATHAQVSVPSANGSKDHISLSLNSIMSSTVLSKATGSMLTNVNAFTVGNASLPASTHLDMKPSSTVFTTGAVSTNTSLSAGLTQRPMVVTVGSTNTGTIPYTNLNMTNSLASKNVLTVSGSSNIAGSGSAIYNLASVAAEQKPLTVPAGEIKPPMAISSSINPLSFISHPVSSHIDAKPQQQYVVVSSANLPSRTQFIQTLVKPDPHTVTSGQAVINTSSQVIMKAPHQLAVSQQQLHNTMTNAVMKTSTPASTNVITMTRPISSTPGITVFRPPSATQVVSGAPPGQTIQIVSSGANVPRLPGNLTTKIIAPAPRPAGLPIKIAPQQQQPGVVPVRTQGNVVPVRTPGNMGTNLVLPPGFQLPPGTVIVKNEQGQLMLMQQPQSAQPKVQIRPQTVNIGVTQPHTVGLSITRAPGVMTLPQTMAVAPGAQMPASIATVRPQVSTMAFTRPPGMATGVATTAVRPLPVAAVSSPAQAAAGSNQGILDSVKKCKNFLSTLLKLASQSNQSPETIKNVKQLIQGLIDGKVEPEEFTAKLQVELKSSPQPYLVPFLKKSLPLLRQSLLLNKMHIDGVRPPPADTLRTHHGLMPLPSGVVSQPGIHTMASTMQQARINQVGLRQVAPIMINRMPLPLGQKMPPANQTKSLLTRPSVSVPASMIPTSSAAVAAAAAAAPATAAALVARSLAATQKVSFTPPASAKFSAPPPQHKEKKKIDPSLKDDDDINDVATMGGVNLHEETRNILATNSELMAGQLRSCRDQTFLQLQPLLARVNSIAERHGLGDVPQDVATVISHAVQERLRGLVEKLDVIAEHRLEIYKTDPKYEVTNEVRPQLKFLEELDRLERKRKEETERENLLRIAKSRTKHEDPEQLKLKEKAKAMQQAEMEELRQREANLTALAAIGPRKKRKLEDSSAVASGSASGTSLAGASPSLSSLGNQRTSVLLRPRLKRVNLRDVLFLLEQERETNKSPLLYKAFLK